MSICVVIKAQPCLYMHLNDTIEMYLPLVPSSVDLKRYNWPPFGRLGAEDMNAWLSGLLSRLTASVIEIETLTSRTLVSSAIVPH